MAYKVILDAGHGIETAGKRSFDGTLLEHEFNLDVAKRLGKILQSHGIEVVYTRTGNQDISLNERCRITNNSKANLLISIHADAYGSTWNSAQGATIYKYTRTPQSTDKLAQCIHDELISTIGINDRGIKRADFQVLRETNVDAVLIEHGFYTNYNECQKLKSSDFRQKCAEGDAKGICDYLGIKYIEDENVVEEDKEVKLPYIVVYDNGINQRIAEYLADILNAPTISAERKFDYSIFDNVYCVGAETTDWTSYMTKLFSGKDRYETMRIVQLFINDEYK